MTKINQKRGLGWPIKIANFFVGPTSNLDQFQWESGTLSQQNLITNRERGKFKAQKVKKFFCEKLKSFSRANYVKESELPLPGLPRRLKGKKEYTKQRRQKVLSRIRKKMKEREGEKSKKKQNWRNKKRFKTFSHFL